MMKNKITSFIKYKINGLGLNKLLGYVVKDDTIICYFDTSISSLNLGDEIINDCGKSEVRKLFSSTRFFIANTHNGISGKTINTANLAKLRIVCGTNLLDANVGFGGGSWNINIWDCLRLKEIVLMGVGWSEYSEKISWSSKLFLRKILSSEYIHSVRDDYTKSKLQSIGIKNVVNTGCPTLWELDYGHCAGIPKQKADTVVFTLTDYSKDSKNDLTLIRILKNSYDYVYFWPQGSNDFKYLQTLEADGISLISPELQSFDKFLQDTKVDYVGTRLHAGIRAMQHQRRTIIISIDNRAIEMGKDFNLPTLNRANIDNELKQYIQSEFETSIKLDLKMIESWQNQFK